MGLDTSHYHGWHGRLHSPWLASAAIVRVALLQVFRRKAYWLVIGLGLLNFLIAWAIIYAVTQIRMPEDARAELLRNFGFSASASGDEENGYIMFMQNQSLVVMLLLAFSGSLLVGSDFRLGSLPFYLSRRIDRRHYVAAKLAAVGLIVSLMTTLPALLLFVEYGLFTSSTDYWLENWRIVISILGYGLVLSAVLSVLLVTLSAYLQRAAPIAITWASIFVLLATIATQMREATDNKYWHLIDPWRNMRYVGRLCFDRLSDPLDRSIAGWAAAILAGVCLVSIAALMRRVRAVEVVE
jgi:hypothetical protein